jgi:putative tryptophan/tyrosine transport system substrate-binding protein
LTEAIAAQIARGAQVIIAYGPERTLKAAVAATRDVPIVMAAVDYDPLAKGYIASLARPGGNITGVFFEQIELAAKRLDLFKAAVPDIRRAVMLWDKNSADQYEAAHEAAVSLGILTVSLEFRDSPYDYERALSEAKVGSGDGLMVMTSPIFTVADRERLPALALQPRLPSMFVFRESVEAGGLMSYGATATEMYRLVARYVGRILKGAKPADLPIEQPTRFERVINLNTANALGLTIASDPRARRRGHRVTRRELMAMLSAAAIARCPSARAQRHSLPLVAFLTPRTSDANTDAFRRGLRELGYVEGQNVALEVRSAEGVENGSGCLTIGVHIKPQGDGFEAASKPGVDYGATLEGRHGQRSC